MAPSTPARQRRRGQHRRGRRRQRLDRRRHRLFDRRQRPGRHLGAGRRHLRRRLHHQCHDRRRHRRRFHQDRLRNAPAAAYTVVAQASDGTLTSSQAFVIAVTDVAPSTPVDSNGGRQPGRGRLGQSAPPSASPRHPPTSTARRHLFADRRYLGRRFHRQCRPPASSLSRISARSSFADPSYDITVDSSDGTLHSQQTFTVNVIPMLPRSSPRATQRPTPRTRPRPRSIRRSP